MHRRKILAGGTASILLLLSLTLAFTSIENVFAQTDPTAQQQTLMAMVNQRFTQTAQAIMPTPDLDATADTLFSQLLTSTSEASAQQAAPSTPTAAQSFTLPSPTLKAAQPLALPSLPPASSPTGINTALPFAPTRTVTPLPTIAPTATANGIGQFDVDAYMTRGWELYWEFPRNYEAANVAFALAAYHQPGWAEPYVGIGISEIEMGEYRAAVNTFTHAIEFDSNDSDLYIWRAWANYELGNFEAVLDDANRAVELNPNRPINYFYQATALNEFERYEEALAAIDNGLAIDPQFIDLYDLRLDAYFALNDEDAARLSDEIQDGLLSWYAGNSEDALADLNRAINSLDSRGLGSPNAPTIAHAYYIRSIVFMGIGEFEAAVDDLSSAIRLAPDFAVAFMQRGYLRAHILNNVDGGIADFNQAIALNPDYAMPYLQLAAISARQGNPTAAAPDYWDWIRVQQSRDIKWELSTIGDPFTLEMEDGWIYHVPFSGNAGDNVNITARAVPIGAAFVDPLIVILDADGTAIMADDDSGGQLDSLIQNFALPADGEYTLIVSHAAGGSRGPVRMSLLVGDALSAPELTAIAPLGPLWTPTPAFSTRMTSW